MKPAIQKKYLVPLEHLIRFIRGQKVMLDHDLAELYGVETGALTRAVRRNIERFPDDFMFQLSRKEANSSRSQFVTLKIKRGQNVKYAPYAFTEHGIAMLSSVLRSPRAVQMNILIVRAFVRLRELISTNKELASRVEKLERSHERTGDVIEILVEDIEKLSQDIHWIKNAPAPRRHRIGFVGKGSEE